MQVVLVVWISLQNGNGRRLLSLFYYKVFT